MIRLGYDVDGFDEDDEYEYYYYDEDIGEHRFREFQQPRADVYGLYSTSKNKKKLWRLI